MLTLGELSQRIVAYQGGRIPLAELENWFEDNSSAAYAMPELKAAWIAVDAAFSQYHYDDIGEDAMRLELVKAILPFVSLPTENHTLGVDAAMVSQSNANIGTCEAMLFAA